MRTDDNSAAHLSRRGFGAALGLGVAAVACPTAPLRAARWTGGIRPAGAAVVGFHADAPYLDRTGRDIPYLPPAMTGRFVPDNESLARIGVFL